MKKQYIAPQIEVFNLQAESVMALSNQFGEGGASGEGRAPERRDGTSRRASDWDEYEAW